MSSCSECGVLLKDDSSVCWNCRRRVAGPGKAAGKDDLTFRDLAAAFLMAAVPLLAYYIVYLRGL